MKNNNIIISILVVFAVLGILFSSGTKNNRTVQHPPVITAIKSQTFSYKGEDGKDALTLLKEKTAVTQNASGLVTSINGRKADSIKREFWAFYVNGKPSTVGPKEYMTKSTDNISWRIEYY